MLSHPSRRARADVLEDAWSRQQLDEFASFVACIAPSARMRIGPVIANSLMLLESALAALDGCQLPVDMDQDTR
jgi:hypothetical protein